jgi:hypothetical protein
VNKAFVYFLVLTLSIFVSFFAIRSHFSAQTTGLLIFILVFVPVLIKPDIGLIIIIASIMLSPEIVLGRAGNRYVTIRIEDVLLLVVIFAWLLRTSFTKDMAGAFRTRLSGPFFLYVVVCLASTSFAVMEGNINIKQSIFTILKYVEYFLLFLMVRDSINSLTQVKTYVAVFLLTALIVAIYSNTYIENQLRAGAEFFRVAPPVETTNVGESGTLGGYLVFMIAVAAGLLLHLRSAAVRMFLLCLLLVMFRAFLYTLSRGSYIAMVPMIIGLICFTRKGKLALIVIVVVAVASLAILAPRMIKERVSMTVVEEYGISGKRLMWEASPADRWESWRIVLLHRFPSKPILGHGVARGFIDGQLFLTLYEVGMAGLFLLGMTLAILFSMAKNVLKLDNIRKDDFAAGLSVGFLAGFVGLLGHALSTNTFIIIKIMEPFWFIAAIVLSLPRLLEKKEAERIASNA